MLDTIDIPQLSKKGRVRGSLDMYTYMNALPSDVFQKNHLIVGSIFPYSVAYLASNSRAKFKIPKESGKRLSSAEILGNINILLLTQNKRFASESNLQ